MESNNQKQIKIICTIGPATESVDKIKGLADAGMSIARCNFSHGSHEEHGNKFAMVREVNATQVAPEDKLTDSVYHYDADAKVFELGEKFVNREQAKEAEQEAKSEEKGSVLSDLKAKKEEVAKQPKKEAIDKGAKSKGETSL